MIFHQQIINNIKQLEGLKNMLNLDVTPIKMSYDEIKSWLDECAAEIEKAYDEDNIS